MEHFLRIAFWIFTLSVTLSDCHPTPTNIIPNFNIEFMKKLTCEKNGQFYTPEPTKDCYKSALECIFIELNGTAKVECHDPEKRIDDGLYTLQMKIKEMSKGQAPSNTSACTCEQWPQKSFTEFLENYKSLLEKENAENAAGR